VQACSRSYHGSYYFLGFLKPGSCGILYHRCSRPRPLAGDADDFGHCGRTVVSFLSCGHLGFAQNCACVDYYRSVGNFSGLNFVGKRNFGKMKEKRFLTDFGCVRIFWRRRLGIQAGEFCVLRAKAKFR
jgi:hypothetical protein